jgi:hypothetical protein
MRNPPLPFIQVTSLRATSSSIPPQQSDNISQLGEVQKISRGMGLLVMRNLPTLSTEVNPMRVSSDIPPQGAGGSSKPVGWEPVVLAYNWKLVVPANLRMKVTFCM